MRQRPHLAVLALAAVLLLALAVVLGLRTSSRHSSSSTQTASAAAATSGFDGAALPLDGPAPGFTLTNLSGRHVSLSDYRGQVTVLAFIYSTCGSACIVIAQQIRGALDELGRHVPVLIVSAEPAADTPAHVESFLASVSLTGRVQYLTGPLARLRPIWHAYHVPRAGAGAEAFGSATPVVLLDRQGRRRVLFQLEQLTPESLAHDIRRLQAG